jgi:predicted RNase H-like HicB family nuclease
LVRLIVRSPTLVLAMKSVSLKIAAVIAILTGGAVAFWIVRSYLERRIVRQALADLTAIRVDDQRHDRGRLAVNNPTEWELFDSRNAQSIEIEYFVLSGEYREFLCKDEVSKRLKVVEPDEDRWHAYAPALVSQGGATWGYTREEALANIADVVQMVVESLVEHGDPIPEEPQDQLQVFSEPRVAVTV